MVRVRKLPLKANSPQGELLAVDVGHVPRRFLPSTDCICGGLDHLTVSSTFVRGQVPERAVRAALITVKPPGFDDVVGLGEQAELVHAQTFLSQAAVKGLNQRHSPRGCQAE